ncbi:threonine synthase [Patescibacteria group bacterium]|nr:threonine synthase [Patescibacteria group bacterium]
MKFHSTNHRTENVPFSDVLLQGLASDGGLFMPDRIPHLSRKFLRDLHRKTFQQIAYEVSRLYITDIPQAKLKMIIRDAFNFPVPLHRIDDSISVLELFHGPTFAFKDFGARFMARLMGYYLGKQKETLNIIVATSGDTGSAVARGFYGVPHIKVFVLYPRGRVTPIQERQMATLGGNITAIAVQGSFDDCQKLAKAALADPALRKKVLMSSANSINFGRLLPQSFYYLYAYAQFAKRYGTEQAVDMAFCVPSGNFGNLTAGILAQRMGMPVKQFIAATNINDVVPRFLHGAPFVSRVSRKTISNAMDVGNPSNFARLLELFHGKRSVMARTIAGMRVSDADTRSTIARTYREMGYIIDPHTAVGITAACLAKKGTKVIVAGTAHPAKFREVVEPVIKKRVPLPSRLRALARKRPHAIPLPNDLAALRAVILKKNNA